MSRKQIYSFLQRGTPHTFRALKHRNFRLFWFGQIISLTGTWMQIVAQSWLVYSITESPLMLGVVNFVGLLPVIPASLIAGVISDRYSRKKIIIIADVILLSQAFITAFLIYLNLIEIWHIILLSFILGAAAAIEGPARLAFVVDTVGKEDLTNAVALNSSVFSTARIVGPALAGITVSLIGEAGSFLINGFTYLAVILALLAIKVKEHKIDDKARSVRPTKSFREGIKFILESQTINSLLFVVAISSFFTMGYVALTTVFSEEVLNAGSSGLGFLMTAVGLGALVGALVVASMKSGNRGKWITVVNIAAPTILLIFSFSRNLYLSLFLLALVAFNSAIRQTLATSLIQIATPAKFQGRVMSIFNLIFNGVSRVGVMAIGGLAEFTGIAMAVGAGAVISLIWGLVVLWKLPNIYQLE